MKRYKKIEPILDKLDDIHNALAGYANEYQPKKVAIKKVKRSIKKIKNKIEKL